jgi:hypothetical protein
MFVLTNTLACITRASIVRGKRFKIQSLVVRQGLPEKIGFICRFWNENKMYKFPFLLIMGPRLKN